MEGLSNLMDDITPFFAAEDRALIIGKVAERIEQDAEADHRQEWFISQPVSQSVNQSVSQSASQSVICQSTAL